jgi:hypothetical protein
LAERNIEENGDVVWPQEDGTFKCFASERVYVRLT